MWIRSTVYLLHGRDPYSLTIKWSSRQKQKYVSTQIRFYGWKVQLQDGKVKWKNSKCRLLTKNLWESMEKKLNLSGIFSQDFHHCRFFKSWQNSVLNTQPHVRDLEWFECVDMRIATDSIFQPLSTQKAQRAGHPFTLIFIEQRDPESFAKTRHRIWKFHKPDHLCANV